MACMGLTAETARSKEPDNDSLGKPRAMNVVWIKLGEKNEISESGLSELSLRISANPSGFAQVAFVENQFNQTGNTCKSSGWIASFVAAQEAGKQLSDYEFAYGMNKDFIDGPSAGMMFAATGLTILENRAPSGEKIAMTGSINPDGTIGPVGGVRHKLEGAIKAGAKKFGYPIGSRLEYDAAKDAFYDLEEMAGKAKVEAVELADINDAVELLTGQPREDRLSKIQVPAAVPEISLDTINRIRSGIGNMTLDIDRNLQRSQEINKAAPLPDWKAQFTQVNEVKAAAMDLQKQGLPIQCYYDLLQAHALGGILLKENRLWSLWKRRVESGYQPTLIEAITLFGEARGYVRAMELALKDQASAGSLSSKINAINAEILLCESKSHLYAGAEQLNLAFNLVASDKLFDANKQQFRIGLETADNVYRTLLHAIQYLALAETRAMAVRDWYSFSRFSDGKKLDVPDDYFKVLATGYSNGAVAALNYFKEYKVKGRWTAEALKSVGAPLLSEQHLDNYRDYLYGYFYRGFPPLKYAAGIAMENAKEMDQRDERISKLWEQAKVEVPSMDRDDEPLTIFGFAAYSYTGFAHLLFQMETFHRPLSNKDGTFNDGPLQLGNRKALARYLDIARDRALRKAELVKQTYQEELPDAIITNLNLSDVKRYGSLDEDRLQAFLGYWRTSLLCDLAMNIHNEYVKPQN